MSKRYCEYSEAERAALGEADFYDAVKVEAIHRGIKVPVPLSDALKNAGFVGFQIPGDALKLHELCVPQQYGEPRPTGLAFHTEEEAKAALRGAVGVYQEGYGATARDRVSFSDNFQIRIRYIPTSGAKNFQKAIEESGDFAPCEAFEKLCEECRDDAARIRQAAYDREVRARKREEYLRLAKGDEAIAAAFWAKVETGEFPAAQEGGAANA